MLRWCIFALFVAAVLAGDEHHKPKKTTKATTTKATTPLPDVPNPGDASAFCFACRSRRNHKDLYADPANCHNYYQCHYINETFAIGYLRNCPAGQFWHDQVLTCMPEGATPCVDACLSDTTSGNKCYAGSGCRQFFVCSNTGSYGMCCPIGSQFNSATCGCDESATCNDACAQAGPSVPTSVAPASQYNSTVCQDSFGRYIATVAGESNSYIQIDVEGHATTKLYCAAGTSFDLATCRCNTENGAATIPTTVANRKAIFYMLFNPPTPKKDLSINNFATFFYDGADVTPLLSAHSTTGGSLNIPRDGAYLSIPGLKTFDYRNSGSWAGTFRCEFAANSYACTQSAGILSNNKDASGSEFTFIFGVQATNSFVAKLNFWHPVNTVTLTGSFTPNANGWTSFVVTYDGTAARLYLNGALADTVFVGSYLSVANCPTVWGSDQQMGTFRGHIDDASIVRFALTAAEVTNFHNTGDLPLDAQ